MKTEIETLIIRKTFGLNLFFGPLEIRLRAGISHYFRTSYILGISICNNKILWYCYIEMLVFLC